jgi:hypothetical protein
MRKLVWLLAVVVMLGVVAIPIVTSGQEGQAGDSNIVQVDLRPPYTWGTMHYNLSGCMLDFVFNGHGLELGKEYVLRFGPYWDKPAGEGGELVWLDLGTGTPNEGGNLHLAGSGNPISIWMLPGTGTWKNRRVELVWWNEASGKWVVVLRATKYNFTYDCPE